METGLNRRGSTEVVSSVVCGRMLRCGLAAGKASGRYNLRSGLGRERGVCWDRRMSRRRAAGSLVAYASAGESVGGVEIRIFAANPALGQIGSCLVSGACDVVGDRIDWDLGAKAGLEDERDDEEEPLHGLGGKTREKEIRKEDGQTEEGGKYSNTRTQHPSRRVQVTCADLGFVPRSGSDQRPGVGKGKGICAVKECEGWIAESRRSELMEQMVARRWHYMRIASSIA